MTLAAVPFEVGAFSTLVVFTFLTISVALKNKHRHDEMRARHETLRQLIESGKLDPQTASQVARELQGDRGRSRGSASGGFTWACFTLGWIGIFTGIALLIGGVAANGPAKDELCLAGAIVGVSSLGIATMPIAWREYQRRQELPGGESM